MNNCYRLAGMFLLIYFACTSPPDSDLTTVYELSGKTATATYQDVIKFYQKLDKAYTNIKLLEMGMSDAGEPMHLVLYSGKGTFEPAYFHENDLPVWLINNGIHPGESCGIDATMMFLRDLVNNNNLSKHKDFLIAAIPVYNIGGALNRNRHTRANQVGPEAYGFRGNAQNYDLNRDFIKLDTRNAAAFMQIFHYLNPDLFLDTHTSDGADFQHVMTLLATQPDKLGEPLTSYIREQVSPFLYQHMEKKGFPMTPYVQPMKQLPEDGIRGFLDAPRYSTGYTALFQTLGFMSEAHMLKSYEQRVAATYALMEVMLDFLLQDGHVLKHKRASTLQNWLAAKDYPLQWILNPDQKSSINFMGYASDTVLGEVTGMPRIRFNQDKPWQRLIDFYEFYQGVNHVSKPKGYLIPQAWQAVIDKLKMNQVIMENLLKDTTIEVTGYKIESYETYNLVYEGHYPHYQVQLLPQVQNITFRAGDVFVPVDQQHSRFIMETLEPGATDSYFNWNFFDAILSRKEYFSSYIFEEKAAEFLNNYPKVRQQFEARKKTDSVFSNNAGEQLRYIYERSPYFEKSYLQYPVYRVH